MTANKYKVVYADPPWQYRDKCKAGERGVEYKYATMSLKELSNLDVGGLAADDCALFMWATMPQLPVAIKLISDWGFVYKTVAFNWVKTNKKSGTPFWGMGNYTRANSELVLLGVKNKPKRISAAVHSVVMSPLGRHSAKPAEVRTRIEQLMGDVKRCELFARETTPGWQVWGDEVKCDFDIPQILTEETLYRRVLKKARAK